ncbi:DNA (cytosine-5-)-methyltransferase [Alcanivorax sp.]|uniref:DNA cytosine methyltransferase n=1 Tax=Alcanivorax sp. TaxID=1872427 RepID=UPI0025C1670B|nr:DNA (cytosine-5-)-methyltransferase [Alcanivorax sp.]
MAKMKDIVAVDLFCGAGGLTHGLLKSKIKVVAGFDIDKHCKYPYEKNNPGAIFYKKDISELKKSELEALYPKNCIKLLAGCAPCQPFSTYSQGRDSSIDKKWPLLYSFSRLIRETLPEIVTMENVPDVTKHKVYHDFVGELEKLGYNIWADKVYCPDYGVPQVRKRHVLLASRVSGISLIPATTPKHKHLTVSDTIKSLPKIPAGGKDLKDPLHISAGLSELNLKRIKASQPGGNWKDWPEELLAECHKKESGRTYVSVYSRMEWDKPSPTITTQCYGFGNGRFGHPDQHRALSLREAALLQSFPKTYQFIEKGKSISISTIGRLIGNAVPVKLGTAIGKSITEHIKEIK